jgi:hypothetical protein
VCPTSLWELHQDHRDLDDLLATFPQALAVLDLHDLAESRVAKQELADFMIVVKLAVRKYMSNEDPPRISSDEVAAESGMDELRLRKVAALMAPEPITGGGGSSESPYHWEYEVFDAVPSFADARTIKDYLARRPKAEDPWAWLTEGWYNSSCLVVRPSIASVGALLHQRNGRQAVRRWSPCRGNFCGLPDCGGQG